MGSKNISISDEAYLRLSELKLKNESFTELIYRLTNKTNVLDLRDIISEDEGKSLEENIGDSMIAGICSRRNEILVTRNIKHFNDIEGLRVES